MPKKIIVKNRYIYVWVTGWLMGSLNIERNPRAFLTACCKSSCVVTPDATWGGYHQAVADEWWEGTSAPHVHPLTHIWLTFRPAQLAVTHHQRPVDSDSMWHARTKTSGSYCTCSVLRIYKREEEFTGSALGLVLKVHFRIQSIVLYARFLENLPQGVRSTHTSTSIQPDSQSIKQHGCFSHIFDSHTTL